MSELDPDIKVLRAKRRGALPTHIVPEDDDRVDKVDDGERIRELTVEGPDGVTETHESSLTAMYRPAPSTTGDVEMLVMEAELIADGVDLANPHIPETEAIRDAALERLASDDLSPAWRQGIDS